VNLEKTISNKKKIDILRMKEFDTTKYRMIETITASAKHRPPLHSDPKIFEPLILPKHDRKIGIGVQVFTGLFAIYGVLFMDFGNREHCFSAIRRAFFGKLNSWMTIRPEDEPYIARRVEEMKLRVKQVDETKAIYGGNN